MALVLKLAADLVEQHISFVQVRLLFILVGGMSFPWMHRMVEFLELVPELPTCWS